ncbi:hypothetical protein CYMTET_35255 [Cymbomonas tetramitiformis]|uniref:Reverse transcriptase Ty1/copia-type domain-containing protein n=1 Tax=Cymbomonas tetramitiformis TaxID=36881 RepID=A0AAE0F9G1_9CHLO|nr:hypothetical protein CYMTET_35255 [Cymbomonas tetramitiformis]
MRVLFRQYKIKHRPGPPYMHEFQAQIEVLWRDMAKIMTTTMKTYAAPLNVWPLAALHAINTIMNAMPNRHLAMDSPHYRFTGSQFDYTQLRPFWSECYVWQDPDQRQKDGETTQVSAKLIDNAPNATTTLATSTAGDTNVYYPCFAQCAARPVDRHKYHPATFVSVDHSPDAQLRYQVYFNSLDAHSTAYCDTDAVVLDTSVKAMLLATRDSDDVPSDFPDDVFMEEPDDIKAKAALLGPNRRHWNAAMDKEMAGVCEQGRAVLTKSFPKDAKVLPTKLVGKKKRNTDGTLDKFKMRCTTRGDLDKSYYSDFGVFAPTANLHTFRLLMALCILHSCIPYHYDVSQAFLQAPIPEDEQYYIKLPKEYVHPEGYIGAKMLYALYGHRTSGRRWSETAHKFMSDNFPKLKRSTFDECLYIGNVNGKLMMVLIYVDDFVVGCADELTKAYFHERIMNTFTATYSGIINQFLQLKIEVTTEINDKGDTVPIKIDISNERSIEHLASKFAINTSKQHPRSPMLEGLNIKLPDADAIDRSIETPLRSIVYSLLWLARTIRPDIYYHVTCLAQFCHTPTAEIMKAAKRILAYVYGTRDFSLTYECDKTLPRLAVYCDADHAGDTSDRNSVSGYCLYLHGMLIDWWSKKQKSSTTLSSTEAEYIAMSEACTSALGIRNTLHEYWDFENSSIPVHIDNEAVTHIATQRQLSSRLKHVEVRYHALRQWCTGENSKFHTVWISTDDNMADIFTKALPITKHGVPLITKHTAALLNIKDRKVQLQEQLQAAAKQQQHAAQQKLEKQQSNESIILATLRIKAWTQSTP